mgnify:FL=1
MQHDMVQVGNKPCFTGWEQVNGIFEALVIARQLFLACPKEGVVPVTEELHRALEQQYRRQCPSAHGGQQPK